ncbi:MAG: hypothetical protein E7612_01965 [Ruminococcaceae bacterium]|nr:hypothetical protein [Oscillospiraceae bacterium]
MENKRTEKAGFFEGIGVMIREGVERRKKEPASLLFDAAVLIIALVFSRFHIVFGAYPLAVAFVAMLPRGVWLAVIGAIVGSLTLGNIGIINAIIIVIVVFLRVIIAGGDRNEDGFLFCEPLVLRISSASIASFIGSAYEVLLRGFSLTSILYACSSVLLTAIFTFAFSGILDSGISFSDFVNGKKELFSVVKRDKERFEIYIFQATFLLFVFLISISLKSYNILGISPAYVFSAFITLLVARRFGCIRGVAVGFVSSLGISSLYSVGFALVGLGAGLLFSAGMAYAYVGGGILLSVWCAYSGGILGFLSAFPEYSIASMLSVPLLRKIQAAKSTTESEIPKSREAQDMVTATALAYRTSRAAGLDGLENALSDVAACLHRLSSEEGAVTLPEYRNISISCVKAFCRECQSYQSCIEQNPAPCVENIETIAQKLYKKERLFPDDTSIAPKYCHNTTALFEDIERACAELEAERFKSRKIEAIAEEYELFSKLLCESRSAIEKEKVQDVALSDKLEDVFLRAGLSNGAIMAFGDRKKYFVGAGEDTDGSLITSAELHKGIEEAAGVRLGVPDYYRKGDIALFECAAAPMFTVDFATVGKRSGEEEISGDTAISFESCDGHFYSLIADGMGSGDAAHITSHFTAEFLSRMLDSSCTKNTAFHILNHIIKSRNEECSSSVDLFDFDLMTGDALFFKCGAAPSYVKRNNSIFRIRSETAPLGLLKTLDAERIRVEVKSGDYIVMLSDGVSQSTEDSAWLLEFLAKEPTVDIREYAEEILTSAIEHSSGCDDMSVSVARIIKL